MQIFADQYMLKLYNENDSFLWRNKKDLLEMCDVLEGKDMYMDCDMLRNYVEYKEKKAKARQDTETNPEAVAALIAQGETLSSAIGDIGPII